MQGKLSEIDIRSILQLIELGQRTGGLFVETYGATNNVNSSRKLDHATGESWFVFFLNGQIIYAGESCGNLTRLQDHLRRYNVDQSPSLTNISAIATINTPEYGHLWALLENRVLTAAQGRSIIQSMVHETLFDLLSLHQGSFIFELGHALSPQLTTLEISSLVARIMKQVQEWKQFHPHIQSPDQCPAIADANQLRQTLSASARTTLERWVDGKTSLRQMARYLNRDISAVARAIYPYLQQGIVHLSAPPAEDFMHSNRELQLLHEHKVPRIVCIDDGLALRKTVECILDQQGYEVTAIGNPLKALSLVFQLKPTLILCDITMPELDGYEICAMLRKSSVFRETPIIMLTGKDGFIDRVKARMVGATDYLTKPFGEVELLTLVEQYVGLGQRDRLKSENLLAEDLKDELELEVRGSFSPFPSHRRR
ncbi:MAG: response regulator [Timaviella obliquedivisa GSE-PSE-MK23-08B]|jgi:twitching motility two-component system response regulator PilG|nr:response regulator [Timaviella obliquedivisa GSE-PSE-MK23-08B]